MDMKKISYEQISAFVDGEVAAPHSDEVLAALRQDDVHSTWDIYHRIGDVLRSDDLAFQMRPDFAARIALSIEAEPSILAPTPERTPAPALLSERRGQESLLRRIAAPAAVAAAISVALVGGSQWMTALRTENLAPPNQLAETSKSQTGLRQAGRAPMTVRQSVVEVNAPSGVFVRDRRIDDYLLAHQRFSPSIYSTAQYVRSAGFSTDPGK